MEIYIFIYLLIFFLTGCELIIPDKKKHGFNVFYFFVFIILLIFAGFRYWTGYDYGSYMSIFDSISQYNYKFSEVDIELGFYLIIKIISLFDVGYNLFLFVIAFLAILIKFIFFKRYTNSYFLPLLLYFGAFYLMNEMGQIRQGLALSIFMLSLKYINERNFKIFFSTFLISISIHNSSIFILPAYFIAHKKFSNKFIFWSIFILMSVFLFDIIYIFQKTISLIPIDFIQGKLNYYLYSDEFGNELGLNLSLILRIFILFLLCYNVNRYSEKYPSLLMFRNLYFFGVVLYLFFNQVQEFAIRSSLYFKFLEILFLPMLVMMLRREKNNMWHFYFVFIILYSFWSLFKILNDDMTGSMFIPYRNFLFE